MIFNQLNRRKNLLKERTKKEDKNQGKRIATRRIRYSAAAIMMAVFVTVGGITENLWIMKGQAAEVQGSGTQLTEVLANTREENTASPEESKSIEDADAPEGTENPEDTNVPAGIDNSEDTNVPEGTGNPADADIPEGTENIEGADIPKETDNLNESESVEVIRDLDETVNHDETEDNVGTESSIETEGVEIAENPLDTESIERTESPGETEGIEGAENPAETEDTEGTESHGETEDIEESENTAKTDYIEETEKTEEINGAEKGTGTEESIEDNIEKSIEETEVELPELQSRLQLLSDSSSLLAAENTTHTLARDSTASGVEMVQDGGSALADSRYAFSLKSSADTRISLWVESQSLLTYLVHGRLTSISHENNLPIYDGYGIVPTNMTPSGKIGVWIWNAGVYNGKKVHARLTFDYKSYKHRDYAETYSTFIISARQDGMLGIDLTDIGARIIFDLFTGTPPETNNVITGNVAGLERVSVDMSLNFGDIDGAQDFGFRANDGAIVSKQVYSNCEIYYRDNVQEYEDYIWMYSNDKDRPVEPDTSGEFRIEMQGVSSFDIIYAGWTNYAYSDVPDFRYGPTQSVHNHLYQQTIDRYTKTRSQVQNHYFNPHEFGSVIDNGITYDNRRALLTYFTAYAFSPYSLPEPEKTVSDSDETGVTENILQYDETEFVYEIRQFVPLERPDYYYDTFTIRDVLPAGLNCGQITVQRDDGVDVTDDFDIITGQASGNQMGITDGEQTGATAYEQTDAASGNQTDSPAGEARCSIRLDAKSAVLASQSFYNQTYKIRIPVEITNISDADGSYVNVDGLVSLENTADTYVTSGGRQQSASTGTVITYVQEAPEFIMPHLRITKRIDRSEVKNGCTSFIFRVTGDNGKWYIVPLTIPPGEFEAGAEIIVEAETADQGGTSYTITELENIQYQLTQITAYTQNISADPGTGQVTAILYAKPDGEDGHDYASVEFYNTCRSSGGMRYSDECINYIGGEL